MYISKSIYIYIYIYILAKCWITAPAAAIIATRPCLISAERSLRKPSRSPTLVKPSGSKKPRGAIAPTCLAGSNGGGGGGAAFFSALASAGAASPSASAMMLAASGVRFEREGFTAAAAATAPTAERPRTEATALPACCGAAVPCCGAARRAGAREAGATKVGAKRHAPPSSTARGRAVCFSMALVAHGCRQGWVGTLVGRALAYT